MTDNNTDLLREAVERFELAYDAEEVNRTEALDDLKFRAGEQWPENVVAERAAANRPIITVNRIPQFVKQVTGEIRQNKPSIKVRPVDDKSDPELAETLTGLIRHIENASDAQVAYITAAESAAACGIGHFRVLTEFADDDAFDQDIIIERIENPFAVLFDPLAKKLTKEDAQYCFVTEFVSEDTYKARWPNASLVDFEGQQVDAATTVWRHDKQIRIAEYWKKVPVKRRIGLLRDGRVVNLDEDGAAALDVVRERTVDSFKVVRYLISGAEVLEGPSDWAGKYIPIIPVVGEEVHIGERLVRHGVVRYAKDAQRLYNYWRTTAAETIALAPKAPFILSTSQIKGLERKWATANTSNLPYLPYNPDPVVPLAVPQRARPADPPAAMWQEAQIASDDMKATTGIYDAALGAKSNETSGRAILARQAEGDTGTYVYADNLGRAIKHCGRILIDLIPKIYDTERVVRILNEDDSEGFTILNQAVMTADGPKIVNDLSAGKYDVTVTTGPSYSTKRMEASDSMMAFVQAVPGAGAVISDLIAKAQDWPGADEIAKRLKKTLPPGIAEPEEGEDPPPAPPADPMMEMEVAAKAEDVRAKQLDNALKELQLSAQTGQFQQEALQAVLEAMQGDAAQSQPDPQMMTDYPAEPGPEPGFAFEGQPGEMPLPMDDALGGVPQQQEDIYQ